jgi:spoIIIJ-associated protein
MSLDKIKIEKSSANLLGHFDPNAKLDITSDETSCKISIETEYSGLLIGRRGETLEALQHILRLIIAKELGEFAPVVVDISGYKALREQEIQDMARAIAEKVANFGGTESLPPMNSYERRLAHLVLQDIAGVEGESIGEGPSRRIVIKPKK